MKIAIVDDELFVRKLLVRSLERDGHDVQAYASGQELLEGEIPSFDLLLLDIVMPGLNGVEVFELLRQRQRFMPAVIFISAFDFTGKLKHIIDNSSVWYLPKPFGLDELREALVRASGYITRYRHCQSTEVLHLHEELLPRKVSDIVPPQ